MNSTQTPSTRAADCPVIKRRVSLNGLRVTINSTGMTAVAKKRVAPALKAVSRSMAVWSASLDAWFRRLAEKPRRRPPVGQRGQYSRGSRIVLLVK